MSRSVDDRRAFILQLVQRDGRVQISALATQLGVSEVTLRRDVESLAADGLVRRTHGGAAIPLERHQPGRVSRSIGLVVPQVGDYYHAIIGGAREAASQANARLILGVSDYDAELEEQQVRRLIAAGVDGVIVTPTPDFETGEISEGQQEWLTAIDLPIVLLERPVVTGPAARLASVSSAHTVAAASAVDHLADLGHTHVALFTIFGPNTQQVREGFRLAVTRREIISEGEVIETQPGSDGTMPSILSLVQAGTTAMLVHNDELATRAMSWLQQAGYRVPADVSIVGYDDTTADLADPPLTAVSPRKEALGRKAAELLISWADARSRGDIGPVEHISLVPDLHVRDSTARVV